MGYELNKLKQMYGLSTPTMATNPRPIAPTPPPPPSGNAAVDDFAKQDYEKALLKYNADLAAYNGDKATYDAYQAEYMRRLRETPMYGASQFTAITDYANQGTQATKPMTVEELYQRYLGREGSTADVANWKKQFGEGPLTDAKINQFLQGAQKEITDRGIVSPDLYRQTGSYYGGVLSPPGSGGFSGNLIVPSAQTPSGGSTGGTGGNTGGTGSNTGGTGGNTGGNTEIVPIVNTSTPTTPVRVVTNPTPTPERNLTNVTGSDSATIRAGSVTPSLTFTSPFFSGAPVDTSGIYTTEDARNASGQGISSTLTDIGQALSSYGELPYLPGGLGMGILGNAITGYQADAMGNAADKLRSIGANPLPGVATISDRNGNVFTISNPNLISASDVADFGTDILQTTNAPDGAGIDDERTADMIFGGGGSRLGSGYFGGTGSFPLPGEELYGDLAGYSNGGAVKRFAFGGLNNLTDKYNITDMANPTDLPVLPDVEPIMLASAPTTTATDAAPVTARAAAPVAPPPARPTPPAPVTAPVAAPGSLGEQLNLAEMLSKYTGQSSYAGELAAARKAATAESARFEEMIRRAMESEAESGPSKAEMYFRLAAAFGAPTKTGSFMESVGNVSSELAKQEKESRESKKASRALRLQLGLKGQEMKMAAAKEDVKALQGLAAEEMKDKRAVATQLIKEYVDSGKPQSEAGRTAKDLGLKPGTPEYEAKVNEIFKNSVDAKMAQVNATLAGLQLRQEQAKKLTPAELKLKEETEGFVASGEQALKDLRQAYKLNPNTFDGSLVDVAQQKLLETFGSKDPRVIATRTQANLLSKQAVGKLRSFFGGNPTEGERAILISLEGIDAKSKEERAIIMQNTFEAVRAKLERDRKRLNDINAGLYRDTTVPKEEGLD